jgi:hypothetical protein
MSAKIYDYKPYTPITEDILLEYLDFLDKEEYKVHGIWALTERFVSERLDGKPPKKETENGTMGE